MDWLAISIVFNVDISIHQFLWIVDSLFAGQRCHNLQIQQTRHHCAGFICLSNWCLSHRVSRLKPESALLIGIAIFVPSRLSKACWSFLLKEKPVSGHGHFASGDSKKKSGFPMNAFGVPSFEGNCSKLLLAWSKQAPANSISARQNTPSDEGKILLLKNERLEKSGCSRGQPQWIQDGSPTRYLGEHSAYIARTPRIAHGAWKSSLGNAQQVEISMICQRPNVPVCLKTQSFKRKNIRYTGQ